MIWCGMIESPWCGLLDQARWMKNWWRSKAQMRGYMMHMVWGSTYDHAEVKGSTWGPRFLTSEWDD